MGGVQRVIARMGIISEKIANIAARIQVELANIIAGMDSIRASDVHPAKGGDVK